MSINNLESNVFQDKLDFKTFESILELLGNVTPKKIPRKDFNNLRGDFLTETGEDKFGKKYDLFLPDDLKVFELPAIISRVNKMTFGEILPDYASKEELKVKITITINTLLQVLSKKNLNENEKKDVQKAIKKYGKLFEDLYGNEESQKLSNENYRSEIIEKSKLSQNYKRFKDYQTILERIKSKEKLDKLLNEVEESLSGELQEHFNESFFEDGVNMLRYGMMTITQAEQEEKIKYCEENGYKKEITKSGKIFYEKGKDAIVIKDKSENLDEKERLLREKIGVDELKKELEEAKNSGNKELIDKIELQSVKKILEVLYSIFYVVDSNNYGYNPKGVKGKKELYCVGYALLGHAFLNELGINHKGFNTNNHTALTVNLGGSNYIFDPTNYNVLKNNDEFEKLYNTKAIVFDEAEKALLTSIYNNKGTALHAVEKYDEAIKMYNLSIMVNKNSSYVYNNKGVALNGVGKYDEAIKMFNKAIELDPNNYFAYENKGKSLNSLKKYDEAIKMFDIAIKLNPNNSFTYSNMGFSLYGLGKIKEAAKMIDIAIKLNPSDSEIYINKCVTLRDLGKVKSSYLYFYAGNLMNGKKITEIKDFQQEKAKIKELITQKNFEGLRQYLLQIEKEEK